MLDPKKFTCHKYILKMVLEEFHQNEEVNPKKEDMIPRKKGTHLLTVNFMCQRG